MHPAHGHVEHSTTTAIALAAARAGAVSLFASVEQSPRDRDDDTVEEHLQDGIRQSKLLTQNELKFVPKLIGVEKLSR